MIISRRQLLGMIITTSAAGTLLTDQALANAIQAVPVDRVTEVLRRARELIVTHRLHRDDLTNPIYVGQWNELLTVMNTAFPEDPHPDDVVAFIDGLLFPRGIDFLNESELHIRAIAEPLVPIVVLRELLMTHRVNPHVAYVDRFAVFADRHKEAIMGIGSVEYRTFADKARYASPPVYWTRGV